MPWLTDPIAAWQQFVALVSGRQTPVASPVALAVPAAASDPLIDAWPEAEVESSIRSAPSEETFRHFPGGQGSPLRPPEPASYLQPIEKRRSVREKVIMPVRCRTKDGQTGRVILSEIAAHGCRLYADDMMLRKGQWITIQPDKMEGMPGIVRWVDAKRAGIEFERPLYDAVAVHLQQLYAVPADLKGTNVRVVSSSISPMAQKGRTGNRR